MSKESDVKKVSFATICSVDDKTFSASVENSLLELPPWVREKMKNIAVLVEDEPSEELRERENLAHDETLLGHYHGIPMTERGANYGIGETLPDTITIFRLPILEEAGDDPHAVERVIAETIFHEVAHYFGMNEHEVRMREEEHDR